MITIIAALTENHVIGSEGKLPWNIPEEMALFRKVTFGKTVVMGRRTFEETGPLEGRENIVVSSSLEPGEDFEVCASLEEALELAKKKGREIFIIGGEKIYEQAMPHAGRMLLSFLKEEFEGDAYFPAFGEKDWSLERAEDRGRFELREYRRK